MSARGALLAGIAALVVLATFRAAASHHTRAAEAPTTLRALYGLAPVTALEPAETALVLVDFQHDLVDGKLALPDADAAVANARELLSWARRSGIVVVHVRHEATRADAPLFAPGSRGAAAVDALAPNAGELVVTKHVAGAFSKTVLDDELRRRGVRTLVIAGIMTHLAVDSTARDATVLGYHVVVAADATATRALPVPGGGAPVDHATMQRAALAALADRFADVRPTGAIVSLPWILHPRDQAPSARPLSEETSQETRRGDTPPPRASASRP